MSQPTPNGSGMKAQHVHIVGVVGVLLLTALVWLLVVSPAMDNRAQAAEHRRAIAEQEAQSEDLRRAVALAERRIDHLKAEERDSPLRLEPYDSINRRLSAVSELAAEHGLDVGVIQPGQAQTLPRFQRVPIQLEGFGTFSDCAAFLHGANKRFPDMGIAAVNITHQPRSGDAAASFSFTLVWYTAPQGTAPAPGSP